MTVDALQLRRARRAIYGPPLTGLFGIALAISGVIGVVATRDNATTVTTRPAVRLIPPKVAASHGYVVVGADGRIYTNGDSSISALVPAGLRGARIVGAARALSGGWWLASDDGRVFASNTPARGSIHLGAHAARIVGIASATNGGYWLASADGHVYSVGAPDFGTRVPEKLTAPVVGIASAPGQGFWLATREGHVYGFGTNSNGELPKSARARIVGIASAPLGGYWLAARDGRVFAFGPAAPVSLGATPSDPVVSIAAPTSGGYWLATETGAVHAVGGAPQLGSLAGTKLHAPIVAIAPR